MNRETDDDHAICAGDYNGTNCHLMKLRRLPTCGPGSDDCHIGPGLLCYTKFANGGEFFLRILYKVP